MEMAKKKINSNSGTSVSSYQQSVNEEKNKMGAYTKKMGTSVRSLQASVKPLQAEFKKHGKEMQEAGRTMIAEGNQNMKAKVKKFTGEIKNQIKENKAAAAHLENGVKFLVGEVNKKKNDFQAYARGQFNNYIKAFWG